MNLLLIDDDLVFLNQLQEHLTSEHHFSIRAADTTLALKLLSEAKVDVVLTGVTVPGAPILSFICKLKGRHPAIPLILLGGSEKNHIIKSALLLGADALLQKPLNFGLLDATISRYTA